MTAPALFISLCSVCKVRSVAASYAVLVCVHLMQGNMMTAPLIYDLFGATSCDHCNATIMQVRLAAEVHRQVRSYAQSIIKPGIKLADMCELLENKNRELVQVCMSLRTVCLALYNVLQYTSKHTAAK
jgi:hypothetical protein